MLTLVCGELPKTEFPDGPGSIRAATRSTTWLMSTAFGWSEYGDCCVAVWESVLLRSCAGRDDAKLLEDSRHLRSGMKVGGEF